MKCRRCLGSDYLGWVPEVVRSPSGLPVVIGYVRCPGGCLGGEVSCCDAAGSGEEGEIEDEDRGV
jgi:hypothetical protein